MAEGVDSARPQAASRLDVTLRTFYVIRHAKAGDREEWSGDDRRRPLTSKGRKQAEELISMLEPFRISAIRSSPYVRCVQTVEPLARALKLRLDTSPSLQEGHGLTGLGEFLADRALGDMVLCTHGDIVFELVEDLVARAVIKAGDGGYQKGSTWVLGVDEHGVAVRARYLSAP